MPGTRKTPYGTRPSSCVATSRAGAILHTLYHGCAEEIVDRVVAKTCLAIPDSQGRSTEFTRLRRENLGVHDEESIVA